MIDMSKYNDRDREDPLYRGTRRVADDTSKTNPYGPDLDPDDPASYKREKTEEEKAAWAEANPTLTDPEQMAPMTYEDLWHSPMWDEAGAFLRNALGGGYAVDTSGIFDAMAPISQRYMDEWTNQKLEESDLNRFGTANLNAIAREQGRITENMSLAQIQAQIEEEQMNRAFMGNMVNPSINLGTTESMYPMQVGQYGMNMASQQQQMELNQFNALLNALGLQGDMYNTLLGNTQPGGYAPPMNYPGTAANLFGSVSPYIFDLLKLLQGDNSGNVNPDDIAGEEGVYNPYGLGGY